MNRGITSLSSSSVLPLAKDIRGKDSKTRASKAEGGDKKRKIRYLKITEQNYSKEKKREQNMKEKDESKGGGGNIRKKKKKREKKEAMLVTFFHLRYR